MSRRFILAILALVIFSGTAIAQDAWIGVAAGGHNGKVLFFGIPSMKLLKEVSLGVDIQDVVASGGSVYAVDKASNKIFVIDLKTLAKTKTISLPSPFGAGSIAITPDGKSLIAAGELTGKVAKVNLATGKVEKTLTVKSQPSAPNIAAVTKNGKHCLITDYIHNSVLVYTVAPFQFVKEIPVDKSPHGIEMTPDGKWALVSNKLAATSSLINVASLTAQKPFETGAGAYDAVIDTKGKFCYQTEQIGDVVAKIDMATKAVVGQYPVQFRPGHLAISPDDQYLVVINKYSTDLFPTYAAKLKGGVVNPVNLQLLSAADGKSIKQVPVSGEPQSILVLAKSQFEGAPFNPPGDLLKAGAKADISRDSKVSKVDYIAMDTHAPGIFETPDGIVEVYLKALSYTFVPNEIRVRKGDRVRFIITNIDKRAGIIKNPDVVHGFIIDGYGAQTNVLLPKGISVVNEFTANLPGTYEYYCGRFCGPVHKEMRGKFIVEE
jgi:YVTN family beta-propeller protein